MKKTEKNKKLIILEHSGGRLANQLLTYISVFAYAKERGYDIANYSFTDYFQYFAIPYPNWFIKQLSNEKIRKNKFVTLLRPYRRYINFIKKTKPQQIVDAGEISQFYLPPTPFRTEKQQKQIMEFERGGTDTLYFRNWMFRNPAGIAKWRNEIVQYFRPNRAIEKSVTKLINSLRGKYSHIVGVHIRQGDYQIYRKELTFDQADIKKMLDQYIEAKELEAKKVAFILCSDGPIDESKFAGLNITKGLGTPVEDLFTLSAADCIIGSDSTFGGFASYYGNIPFIIFKKPVIDWDYYKGKDAYFENKNSSVIFY